MGLFYIYTMLMKLILKGLNMKVYKASALAHKGRSDILDEAMESGVVINRCATNGKILNSMVIISKKKFDEAMKNE